MTASGKSPTHLSWLAPANSGGSSTILYDVLRSSSPNGFSGAQCLASGIPELSYDDSGFTGTGYYLIRSRNACGSSLGAASSGVPRTGASCPQSDGGQCFDNLDCVTTACCGGFCRNLTSSTENCGTCGNACPSPPHASALCTNSQCGLACNAGYENCNVDPGDGCETDPAIDPSHCGSCGNVCPAAPNANPSCSASACGITCNAGYVSCDGSPGNGCECAGGICCPGGCEPPHSNGLGQSFDDCAPSGVPGNAATYSHALAVNARAAWPFIGTDSDCSCGGGTNCVFRQTPNRCAVWIYSSTRAGRVLLNTVNNTCTCPSTTDPTWF